MIGLSLLTITMDISIIRKNDPATHSIWLKGTNGKLQGGGHPQLYMDYNPTKYRYITSKTMVKLDLCAPT